jgi:hypothetical protein
MRDLLTAGQDSGEDRMEEDDEEEEEEEKEEERMDEQQEEPLVHFVSLKAASEKRCPKAPRHRKFPPAHHGYQHLYHGQWDQGGSTIMFIRFVGVIPVLRLSGWGGVSS